MITVQALEQIDVRLELAPLQVEAQLAVTVSPADSVVTVNGQPVTEQREGRVEVSLVPGVHQVTVSHPGYLTQSRELDARAGVEYPLTIHLKPDSDVTPGLWILGVGGSAALASGVIGGVTLAGAAPGSQENRAGTSWMLGSMGLSLVTSVTWQVWSSADAPAGSARGYLNRTFIAGNTPGEPSMNKLVVVSALHGATLAAVGVGVWKYLAMRETARESDRAGAIGLCADADASPCAAWNADRQVIDRDRKLSISLIGSAAVLHLIGMAVAEGWSNVTASTDGQAGTASLHGTF